MGRLLLHESTLVRVRRLIHSHSFLLPTSILGVLNLCILFTTILVLLFVFSLSLTFIFFVNITQLQTIEDVPFREVKNSSNSSDWNSFIENFKHHRRGKWFSRHDYSKILQNSDPSGAKYKFDALLHPRESARNCSKFPRRSHLRQKTLNLVIVIHSACNNSVSRQLIRRQFAADDDISTRQIAISHVFILGTTSNQSLMSEIRHESERFADILQLNFEDSYQKLSLKHVSSLRWPLEYCHRTDIIVKLDDDAFVDHRALISTIESFPNFTNLLACSIFPNKTPTKRNGKWALSRQEYSFETYPSYCSGVGYLLTPDVAFDLIDALNHNINNIPIVGIDDVFITGMIRSLLVPQPFVVKLNDRFEYKASKMRQWLRDVENICPSGVLIADIGDQSDRLLLTVQLFNKTVNSWTNKSAKCNNNHSQSSRLSL